MPMMLNAVTGSPVTMPNSTGIEAAPVAVIGATTAIEPLPSPLNSSMAPAPPATPAPRPQAMSPAPGEPSMLRPPGPKRTATNSSAMTEAR